MRRRMIRGCGGIESAMTKNGNPESFFSRALPLDETCAPHPVFTGRACNFKCVYCCLRDSEPQSVSSEQLLVQMRIAAESGAQSVVFVGGEPTLNRALPACIAMASEFSFASVGIRTNGMMFLYPAYVEKLINNGLSFVQISHVSHDGSIFDEIVNVPGAHGKVMKGVANVAEAGIAVSVTIPLVRSTFSHIAEDVGYVLNEFRTVKNIELRAVGYNRGCEPVPIQEMEAALPGVMAICDEHGAAMSFGPFEGIPPCLFKEPGLPPSIFRYPSAPYYLKSSFEKIPQCVECPLDALCNGIREEYIDHFRPGKSGGIGQRLSAAVARGAMIKTRGVERDASRAEKAAVDGAVTISYRDAPGGEPVINECIIRANYRCNQDCLFCFVDTHCGGPPEEVILKTAEELRKTEKKISIVSISGGEPTMNARLEEYLGILREAGAMELCLQTNAVLLSAPERAAALAARGLDSAFVSLHSHDEVVSDLITGNEGAFRRTVKGIENLAGNGVFVYISHVINSFNYATLPDFVDFVDRSLQGMPIVFSFAAPHKYEMMSGGAIPRLSRVRGPLRDALQCCIDRRIPFSGLPGMCGIPLCILGPDIRFYPDIHPVNQTALQGVMHKNSGCRTCSLNDWCYGVRVFYVSMYGDEEITPVRIDGFNPKLRNLESRMTFFKTFFD